MLTLDEIIEALQYVQREYGNDSKVAINIYDDNNVYGDYATYICCGKDGTVYISNKRPKRKFAELVVIGGKE